MLPPPITLAIRVQQAAVVLLFAGIVWSVGLALLRAIGKSSPARRRHGRFVLGWMLAGWLVGGAIGVWTLDNVRYHPYGADTGTAGFGLLLGWAVGMVHGGIVCAVWPASRSSMAPGSAAGDSG